LLNLKENSFEVTSPIFNVTPGVKTVEMESNRQRFRKRKKRLLVEIEI